MVLKDKEANMQVEITVIADGIVVLRTRNNYNCSDLKAHSRATKFGIRWASEWGYRYPTINVKTCS
jgi:hypothetical protein